MTYIFIFFMLTFLRLLTIVQASGHIHVTKDNTFNKMIELGDHNKENENKGLDEFLTDSRTIVNSTRYIFFTH